jgi:hypothetical protein
MSFESGLAAYGKFRSVVGAITGVIIAIIMVLIGFLMVNSPFKAAANMVVTKVVTCNRHVATSPGAHSAPSAHVAYACVLDVHYKTAAGVAVSVANVPYSSGSPVVPGQVLRLRYEPKNPQDVMQTPSPKMGWELIAGGCLIGALGVGTAWLSFRDRHFAEFEGAVGAMNMANRAM